jgi:hypothetical protein
VQIKEFTEDDYKGVTPYEYCYQYNNNKFELEKVLHILSVQAKKNGITNFKAMYKAYVQSQKNTNKEAKTGNITDFTGQQIELNSGKWNADDMGVSFKNSDGIEEFACEHPIIINERLFNIDTNTERVNLAFSRGRKWRNIIVSKSIIANSRKIIDLADMGVGVTSENAKYLVTYLHDLENENYTDIPEKKCCSRLGWIDGEGFSPYCSELTFDGDMNLASLFNAIHEKGNFEKWKKEIIENCNFNFINKIIIGASLSSVLISKLGINNYFLHLWADTETAKTVSIMLGASVWGNPELGKYIQTWNSTGVGKERFAAIANSLPVFFDELQIVTEKKQFDREIYELCEGVGRLRGNKFGGTDTTATWRTCFLSTGEKPILNENSGGGATNRIIEIECLEKLVVDGKKTCDIIKNNYGYAGKLFVEHIKNTNIELINNKYIENYKKIQEKTEKQTQIGAVILTAFELSKELIFDNKINLTADEVAQFLNAKENLSPNIKYYNILFDWITQNSKKFTNKDNTGDIFGKMDKGICYIIKSVFDNMCKEKSIHPTALLSWMKNNKKISLSDKKTTTPIRINGILTRCVAVYIDNIEDSENPFE